MNDNEHDVKNNTNIHFEMKNSITSLLHLKVRLQISVPYPSPPAPLLHLDRLLPQNKLREAVLNISFVVVDDDSRP